MTVIISIDPGARYTGYAYNDCMSNEIMYGVLKANDAELMCDEFYQFLDSFPLSIRNSFCLVIEYPNYRSSGVGSVSIKKGDIFKLAYLVGRFHQIAILLGYTQVELPTPNDWKGTLPKEIVIQRIKEQLNIEPGNHAADAVGMILYKQGRLNNVPK